MEGPRDLDFFSNALFGVGEHGVLTSSLGS